MSSDPYYKTKHWRDLRAERLRIDMHTCVVPGCNAPAYAVDHVKSRRAGGSDTSAQTAGASSARCC